MWCRSGPVGLLHPPVRLLQQVGCLVFLLAALSVRTASAKHGFCHLLYVNADTDLEYFQVRNMQQVLQLDASPYFSAFLYMDRLERGVDEAMPYLYTEGGLPTSAEISTAIYAVMQPRPHGFGPRNSWYIRQRLGELDSADPPSVLGFARWALAQCRPDQHLVISFSMHGGGLSGISADDSNGKSSLSLAKLKDAFGALAREGRTFDIIGFDACLMSSFEVATALQPFATYLLASEPVEPRDGWKYSSIDTRAQGPVEYARSIVQGYLAQSGGPQELVLIDLAKFQQFSLQFGDLVGNLASGMASGDEVLKVAVDRAREDTSEYEGSWDSFKAWFNLYDEVTADERSQMDIGSFLHNLQVHCPELSEIPSLIAGLTDAVLLERAPGSEAATCTGPGCAYGTSGLAIWFKRRRFVRAMYEYYVQTSGLPLESVLEKQGPMVQPRLDQELRQGFPKWYDFLASYYTWKKRPGSASLCRGAALSGAAARSWPTLPPPASPAVRCRDGDTGGQLCQFVTISASGGVTTVSLPGLGRSQYPDGLHGFIDVAGPSTVHFSKFGLESSSGCSSDYLRIGGKKYCGFKMPADTTVSDRDVLTFFSDSSVAGPGFKFTVTAAGGGSPSFRSGLGAAPVALSAGQLERPASTTGLAGPQGLPASAAGVDLPDGPCTAEEALCDLETYRDPAGGLHVSGSVASWVSGVEMFIGLERTWGLDHEFLWTMQVPTRFTRANTFVARWNNLVPYVVSSNDECAAFVRVAAPDFAQVESCRGQNVTLSAPVRYYADQEAYLQAKHRYGALQLQVECESFSPLGEVELRVPGEHEDEAVPRRVARSAGGLVVPLVRAGPAASWSSATLAPCRSAAPLRWGGTVALELVAFGSPQSRSDVHAAYHQLVLSGFHEAFPEEGGGVGGAGVTVVGPAVKASRLLEDDASAGVAMWSIARVGRSWGVAGIWGIAAAGIVASCVAFLARARGASGTGELLLSSDF